ncbi:GntR family transcriptional regulator [Helcobacillus massiliensis]|uniref:GntR family transcriptional regulator n=1 Tax=Helcobacillus massiliensis TaxID=521392 RepID=UPI0021A929B9|nr:GntR family transcriptional regulator [Helcobacillus massiliensis]MCT1557944.1 GntR family transcriptional regulator [Helcobacillus massiliensis]MCT2037343.1 GntR family transcriptional regulator [Helcobacillus massiliensis]MCT2332946.1 GntR family transcriptional regulator [Helcobacillus massiliensis]
MAQPRTLPDVLLHPEVSSLTEEAYARLLDRLVFLDIAPGDALNDADLSSELGIGRTPVRSAFHTLENEGLLTTYPRRGTFASAMDVKDLTSITDLRCILEPLAARRAAENASHHDRSAMRGIREEILAGVSGTSRELLAYELRIHRAIYAASGNRYLADVLRSLDHLAGRIWALVVDQLGDLTEHIREHLALLDAIDAGDADRAAEIAAEHVRAFEEKVRRAF